MTHNLEAALQRGAALDEMDVKANDLRDSAVTFHRNATEIKRQMCLERYKWYFLGIAVGAVVIFVLVWNICGMSFSKC